MSGIINMAPSGIWNCTHCRHNVNPFTLSLSGLEAKVAHPEQATEAPNLAQGCWVGQRHSPPDSFRLTQSRSWQSISTISSTTTPIRVSAMQCTCESKQQQHASNYINLNIIVMAVKLSYETKPILCVPDYEYVYSCCNIFGHFLHGDVSGDWLDFGANPPSGRLRNCTVYTSRIESIQQVWHGLFVLKLIHECQHAIIMNWDGCVKACCHLQTTCLSHFCT